MRASDKDADKTATQRRPTKPSAAKPPRRPPVQSVKPAAPAAVDLTGLRRD